MAQLINPIITTVELLKIASHPNLVIIDARSGKEAYEKYIQQHLKGAQHADLDKELSSINKNTAAGGRHPLPDLKSFSELLGKLGISTSSIVVVYDDKAGANAAARFWWMLKNVGHENVAVISGGMDAAIQSGFPVASGIEKKEIKQNYPVKNWSEKQASIEEVEQATANENYLVIDVREAARYQGKAEPIDRIAGHIPGAVNSPYSENLDANGEFKSANELQRHYKDIIGNRQPSQVIVHCGSGVTACHTLLAMEQAGIKGAKLFVGSWSQWSESGRPVATDK
jgi:3-mercaptopyruvate sulfurtransferase SseA